MFKSYKSGQKQAAKQIYEYCKTTKSVIQVMAHIRRNFGEIE